jgi:hypothetical protein
VIPGNCGSKIPTLAGSFWAIRSQSTKYDEKHIITWGTKFGPLWKDVLTFIKQKGIKARGIALPKMQGERGPSD